MIRLVFRLIYGALLVGGVRRGGVVRLRAGDRGPFRHGPGLDRHDAGSRGDVGPVGRSPARGAKRPRALRRQSPARPRPAPAARGRIARQARPGRARRLIARRPGDPRSGARRPRAESGRPEAVARIARARRRLLVPGPVGPPGHRRPGSGRRDSRRQGRARPRPDEPGRPGRPDGDAGLRRQGRPDRCASASKNSGSGSAARASRRTTASRANTDPQAVPARGLSAVQPRGRLADRIPRCRTRAVRRRGHEGSHRAVAAGGRLRPPRRGPRRRGGRRSGSGSRGRDGRPLRAQPDDRSAGRPGPAQGDAPAPRRPPDDRAAGANARGIPRRRRRLGFRARGIDAAPPALPRRDPAGGRPGGRRAQPRDPDGGSRGFLAGPRLRRRDVRQSGLGRPDVPEDFGRKGAPASPRSGPKRARGSRSRSTAASEKATPESSPRPARRSWWPGRPSTVRPTPPAPLPG